MGRLMLIVCLALCFSLGAFAQVNTNADVKTLEQLMLNSALQEGVEYLHNEQVDSIKKKQEKLLGLATSLAGMKNLFMMTLENAKGFGTESGIYKSIVATSLSIVTRAGQASKAIMDSNLTGKAIASMKVYGLMTEAAHLGNLFFNIVTNSTVENPLKSKMPGSESSKKDELNLLNRHEHLYMALKISMELKKIDHDLVMICYYCKYNSLSDLLLHVDRETWVNYHYANFTARQLIDKWNGLVKK